MRSSITYLIFKCHTPRNSLSSSLADLVSARRHGGPRANTKADCFIDASTVISVSANQTCVYYLQQVLPLQSRLTAHTHTCTLVGGFGPIRRGSPHNNSSVRHTLMCSRIFQEMMSVVSPRVAFAKKILLQHAACQSACEVTRGYVFRWSNLWWRSCEEASAIHVWAGTQGKQPCVSEDVNEICLRLHAGQNGSASPGLLKDERPDVCRCQK